jgi:hypothetical protein
MNQIRLLLIFLLLGVTVTAADAEKSATEQLEEKYFQTLDGWIKRGGLVNELQDAVVKTCGKLVMLTASNSEKVSLLTTQRDEFHHRVDVCTKMTVNRVHPQPEFEKKEIIRTICDESKENLFKKLCKRYGFR